MNRLAEGPDTPGPERAPSVLLSPIGLTAVLLLTTAACYLPALSAGFVWDDHIQVVGNTLTEPPADPAAIFTTDVWSSAGVVVDRPPYYRPLLIASFALDRALFGLTPWAHHLQSLLWHLLAVLAVLALLRRFLPFGPALFGAALFALHPVQSEAVIWISARNDPMAAAFGFTALTLLLPRDVSVGRLLLGAALFLAALLSKETALMLPALLLAADWLRHGRPVGPGRYLAVSAAVAAWALLRAQAGVGGPPPIDGEALLELAGRAPWITALYGKLLLLPFPLTIGRRLSELDLSALTLVFGNAALLAGVSFTLLRGRGPAAAGWILAAAAFAPTVLGMAATGQLGERYVYVPMAGVALAAGAALRDRPRLHWAAVLLVPAVLLIQVRLPDWRDDVALTAQAQRVLDTPCTRAMHGAELYRAGGAPEGLPLLESALTASSPCVIECSAALRASLAVSKQGALDMLRIVHEAGCPRDGELLATAAVVLAMNGDWEAAAETFPAARRGPPQLWMPVAGALLRIGGSMEAYRALRDEQGTPWFEPRELDSLVRSLLVEGGAELQDGRGSDSVGSPSPEPGDPP